MTVSKRVGWFFVVFGVWSWLIWPTFLKNIWADPRSWNHGMTAFFGVHLVLTVVSLTLGTIIGLYGVRALVRLRSVEAEARELLTKALASEAVTVLDLLSTDEGADIDFEPERLGLTARSAEL